MRIRTWDGGGGGERRPHHVTITAQALNAAVEPSPALDTQKSNKLIKTLKKLKFCPYITSMVGIYLHSNGDILYSDLRRMIETW